MTAPDLSLTVKDGGLMLLPQSADGVHVKLGVASGLTALQLYEFSTPAALQSSGGVGPAVDAAAVTLNTVVNGVSPSKVLIFPVTPSTAATSGSVTVTRTSTSTGTVATTGSAPKDQYDVKFVITKTGTVGTGEFKYTLDGGDTYSAAIQIPGGGTYTVPGGVGVVGVFTAGGGPTFFEAGDTFSWTTTAPAMTTGDIATAITALLAITTAWEGIHVVGAPADHTATAALFAALAAHADTLEASKRYRWVFMEAADATDANLQTAMASSSHVRLLVGAGFEELYIPTSKLTLKRPSAWPIIGRGMAVPVHEDVAQVSSGPLSGIVSLYRNEDTATTKLDDSRFSTLREFVNKDPPGFYVTNAKIFGSPTSDFRYWQHRRVMDKACSFARPILLKLLSSNVRVETTGERKGFILEKEALQIDKSATAQLRAAMSKHVTDIAIRLGRTDPILSTEELTAQIAVVPFGYIKKLTVTIGFVNPAFQPGAV